jgi:two-component system LytT family response regulator
MTKPIGVLIVDDEPAARDTIRGLLAADPEVTIAGECGDGRSALAAIRDTAPQIVFLDVQMPEMDGFAMLRQVEPSALPVVVFTTAYDQYALRAFEVHALDYLLKPFDDDRFREALGRAKERARQKRVGALSGELRSLIALLEGGGPGEARDARPARILVRSGERAVVVAVREIDWIDADGDALAIHAGRERYGLRERLKDLEQRLDPARFVRIHRSTIVNVDRVRELQPYYRGEIVVVLHDGTRLKVSRGCRARLEAVLGGKA